MSGYSQINFTREARDYTRTLESIYGSTGKEPDLSLAGWRKRAALTREALLVIRAEHDSKKAEADRELSTMRSMDEKIKLDAEFAEFAETAKRHIQVDFDATALKIQDSFKAAMSRMSTEQVNLLSVLSMRTSLSSDELAFYSGLCGDSLPALYLIADVAKKNGIAFPHVLTPREFEDAMEAVKAGVESYLADIAVTAADPEANYYSLAFWEGEGNFREGGLYSTLDSAGFLVSDVNSNGMNSYEPTA